MREKIPVKKEMHQMSISFFMDNFRDWNLNFSNPDIFEIRFLTVILQSNPAF